MLGDPKNNGLLRQKNIKEVIPKQKGTRIAEDGEYGKELEMTILKSLANFLRYTNDDVAPLSFYSAVLINSKLDYPCRLSSRSDSAPQSTPPKKLTGKLS